MNENGYIFKNSPIHKMNPALKILGAVLFIIIVFLPYGFLFQTVVLGLLLAIYFFAKLPFKKLFRIFISILVMGAILLLINWVTYKSPGLIFDLYNPKNFVVKQLWDSSNSSVAIIDGKYFVQGTLWGSSYVEGKEDIFGVIPGLTIKGSSKGFYIIDGISNFDDLNSVIKKIEDSGFRFEYQQVDQTNTYYFYIYQKNIWSLSSYAITYMIFVSMKVLLMILIVTILTSTTSSIELTCAIEDILSPLKIIKIPVNEMSMIIALAIRFIPSLLDESNRVLKAQASRGSDFTNGTFIDKLKSLSSLIIPLFSISFKKADELSNAMEAKAYNPRKERTRYRVYQISWIDWIFYGIIAALLGVAIGLIAINGKSIIVSTWIYDCIQILN